MQTYKCIIIEDEPLAAEVLQDYIRQVPFLELACCCSDAFYAMDSLQKFDIDLMFLENPPKIIITTAYQEYALQGYEFNVIDYLLKPIEFSRFLKAVNKIEQSKEVVLPARPIARSTERAYLFFSVGKKKVKVFLDEILYIESMKE